MQHLYCLSTVAVDRMAGCLSSCFLKDMAHESNTCLYLISNVRDSCNASKALLHAFVLPHICILNLKF